MKRLFTLVIMMALLGVGLMQAQMFREDGYNYYYDYDHRVVTRSCTECTYDYQDLWNGDYVRLINGRVYIYRGQTRVTYGDRVWLEHTGNYTVEISGTQYLEDEDGDRTGVYGSTINVLWNGVCSVKRGSYWYLYTRNNYRLGNAYSTENFALFWNGYYCYSTPDGYYRVADEDGDQLNNSYSQEEPTLLNSGCFRYLRNGNYYVFDVNGNRQY